MWIFKIAIYFRRTLCAQFKHILPSFYDVHCSAHLGKFIRHIQDIEIRKCFMSFRIVAHKLEIEKGGYKELDSQNELSSPIRSFLCPIPILACKQCIF